ncbi:nitrile hydratase subunit beta [Falsihalocynthiibacter sp. SS001]|uniref:nitrile hydratase subunit beta n=1 Tax=Falsihalocynthiibacter sp. SS001 TaxID=3349698 RepID=UPI0036D3F3A5
MSRIHDMGGRFGDGPIPEKDDNEVFHSEWEARALALNLACGALGAWNIDASRHARECLAPKDYSAFTYYEKWLAGLTDILVEREVISRDDLDRASASIASDQPPSPAQEQHPRIFRAENVLKGVTTRVPYSRDIAGAPRFVVGARVRAVPHARNKSVEGGHTRLPRYAAGRVGTIELIHGAHVFPDSNAHFQGEAPEPLYAVRFTAQELWGTDTNDEMVLDLWESYLEPIE